MKKTMYNEIEVPKNHVRKALDNKDNEGFIYADNDSVVFAGKSSEMLTLLSMIISSLSNLVDDKLIKVAVRLGFKKDKLDKELSEKEFLELIKEIAEDELKDL